VTDKWGHTAEYYRDRRTKARVKREEDGVANTDTLNAAIVRQRGQELVMMMRTPVCMWPQYLLDEFAKKPKT
jgi:hypothetical protein